MALEEKGEVLHEQLAEFLRQEEIDAWRVFADREEDFVGRVETREVVHSRTDFHQDGHGVGELAFGEVREGDVD